MTWEFQFLDWIQANCRNSFLDNVMIVITFLGKAGWFWIALTLLLFIPKRARKYAHVAAIALLLGLIIGNLILKPMIARVRPFDVQQVALLVKAPTDYSFPSGHTQAAFATAISLLMWKKRYGIPALILAVLMAFSRMYLYVHYPTDVLAGLFCGVTYAFIGLWIANRLFKNKPWDGCAGAEDRAKQLTANQTEA